MSNKLTVENLCYSTEGKTLLQDISVEFSPGQMHAILGPNGSGKSTLLMALSGIRKLSGGNVLWEDRPLLSLKRQEISRIISLVPQHPQPSFDFLVEDIVAMGRYPHTMHYWQAKETPIVQQALTCVDAWHLRHRKVTRLSYGERQRVYIARALVTESPILLLDEPTASLDIRHQLEIWQLLQTLVANGKIVVVTTHDLTVAERYCQQIFVLNHGQCVSQGTFSYVMTSHLLQEVFGISKTDFQPISEYRLSCKGLCETNTPLKETFSCS